MKYYNYQALILKLKDCSYTRFHDTHKEVYSVDPTFTCIQHEQALQKFQAAAAFQ